MKSVLTAIIVSFIAVTASHAAPSQGVMTEHKNVVPKLIRGNAPASGATPAAKSKVAPYGPSAGTAETLPYDVTVITWRDLARQDPRDPEPLWVNGDILISGTDFPDRKPSMASDTYGNLYCAYEVEDTASTRIHISRSTNGGITWQLCTILYASSDLTQPSIAVGQGNGEERLILTHVKGDWAVQAAWWTLDMFDHEGVTIEYNVDGICNPRVVTDASEQSTWFAYVVYNSRGADSWLLRLSRSRDYGLTWDRPFTLHEYCELPSYYDATDAYPDIEFGSGIVYVGFDDYADGTTERDIHIVSSADYGSNWTAPTTVASSPYDEFAPGLAAVKDYGEHRTVVAAYTKAYSLYDWDIWYAFTQNGGGTWNTDNCLACYSDRMELMCDLATSYSQGNIHIAFFDDGTTRYTSAPHTSPSTWAPLYDASNPGVTNETWPRPAVTVDPTEPLATEAGMAWTDDRAASFEVYFDGAGTDDADVPVRDTSPGPALSLRCLPNPFRASTSVSFSLPEQARVEAGVYDARGRRVRDLANAVVFPAGTCRLRWDGCDDSGRDLGPGIYFLRVRAPGRRAQTKVVRLR